MTDDDEPGGTPACFLDEVDPAYAGYLTDAEVARFLAELLVREHAALAAARAREAPDADALARLVAGLDGELARRRTAPSDRGAPRFVAPPDSTAPPADLGALEAALIAMLETTLPRIADDALHDALNRALDTHRRRQAARPIR